MIAAKNYANRKRFNKNKEQERIKSAAYKTFLADGISVASLWNDNVYPDRHFSADEDEFREMARKLFAPKEEE